MLWKRLLSLAVIATVTLVFFAGRGAEAAPPAGHLELDPVSAACIACHDGTEAPHAGFCLLAQEGEKPGGHVISAPYAALATNNRGLRAPGSLPLELVLYDGLITCATCHGIDPHGGTPLVIDNAGSALCQGCHLK